MTRPGAIRSDHVTSVLMIGNAHIDPVWIWDWHEGMHEVLQTFRAALDHLDEDSDLVFCASSSAFYDWVERVDPDLFARVRNAIVSGRWVVVGGQWVEPDCNLPAGEAVCRQFLYGQRYLVSRFGEPATVGWNIDAFGHTASLPQILVASGLRAYVMMRPGEHEKVIPSPLFEWVGSDGTSIVTYRVPFHYATDSFGEDAILRERTSQLLEQADALGRPLMCLFGVGDHGGGPTRLALATIHELTDTTQGRVAMASPVSYFERLPPERLPTVEGDLQWHAVGCYSARGHTKRNNSRAEQALITAEKMERLCRMLTGLELPVDGALERGWHSLLFSQFHDALGGTCTDGAAEGVDHLVEEALAIADRVSTLALHALTQQVDTWIEGADRAEGLEASAFGGLPIPIIVCNPLSWSVTVTTSVPYPVAACTDVAGRLHPVQHTASGEITYSPARSLLQLPVPPLGYARFWLHATGAPPGSTEDLPTAASHRADPATHTLANERLEVDVDAVTGVVCRLHDGAAGRQWLGTPGIRCVVVADESDTWSHGVERYDGEERAWECEGVAAVETGPVRATVRARFRYASSTMIQLISLYRGQDFVEVSTDIEWHERHQLVKLAIPLLMNDPVCTAGAPYGFAERELSGHEEPMVHWVDLSERGGTGGMSCTSRGTYAYDATTSQLRMTLLRSSRVADHGHAWGGNDTLGFPFLDQGRHSFSLRLHPHHGSRKDSGAARRAEEHLLIPPLVIDTWHTGRLGPAASVLEVEKGSAVISAVKRAENALGSVVRLWESDGWPTTAVISFHQREDRWRSTMAAHELQTLFVPDDAADPVRLIDLCEINLDGSDR